MSTFQPSYGSNTAITISLASLGNAAYQQCAAVDNSINKYADAFIYGHVKSGGTPTAGNLYTLFLYWSNDGGTTYTNNASGANASYTQPDSDSNMTVGSSSLCVATASLVSYFRGFSFCQAAGLLFLPRNWGIILKNGSGQALTATSTDHVFSYMGVNWAST